jgi:TRAP-type C4-dicarboxylate transport system permease small subunit
VTGSGSGTGRALSRGFDYLALAAGWALLGLSALVGFEVVVRKLFAFSIKGVDEIGGYVLAIGSAIGFIHALVHHGHIRVDLVLRHLGPRLRALMHLAAHLALAALAVLLAWRAASVWLRSIALDAVAPTPLATPLSIPQGAWVLALAAFAALALWRVAQLGLMLAREGPAAVERAFHADRMLEELETERRAALRRGAGSARR